MLLERIHATDGRSVAPITLSPSILSFITDLQGFLTWVLALLKATIDTTSTRDSQISQDAFSNLPVSTYSVYETVLCATAIPLLAIRVALDADDQQIIADTNIRSNITILLETFAEVLEKSLRDIALLARRVALLPPGSHMFMIVPAIETICFGLRSLVVGPYQIIGSVTAVPTASRHGEAGTFYQSSHSPERTIGSLVRGLRHISNEGSGSLVGALMALEEIEEDGLRGDA